MVRYTEYHCGKAVIKDKALLSAAMQKLASYEDAEECADFPFFKNPKMELPKIGESVAVIGKTKAGYIKIENGSCDVDQRWYGLNEPMEVIGWMPIK